MPPSGQSEHRRVGTLGSELTFAGQAAKVLLARRPDYVGTDYFPTMDGVAEAVLTGAIDLALLTSETSNTACTDTAARLLAGAKLYIADEVVVPYHCALLGRPGTTLADIRHVGGHGSIRQCGDFLREQLPDATVEIHRENSVQAARQVLEGDGTSAVIGTLAVAHALGLEVIAADVDHGSSAGWWALSASLQPSPIADHVALRVDGSTELTELLTLLHALGLLVRTVTNAPTGDLFRYRYLVVARAQDDSLIDLGGLRRFADDVIGVFASASA